MFPACLSVIRTCPLSHCLNGAKDRLGFVTELVIHGLGIAAQRQGARRDGVKAFADGEGAIVESVDDDLRHVIGIDVMDGFEPEIRQRGRDGQC